MKKFVHFMITLIILITQSLSAESANGSVQRSKAGVLAQHNVTNFVHLYHNSYQDSWIEAEFVVPTPAIEEDFAV